MNLKSLIQPSEILSIELIRTHPMPIFLLVNKYFIDGAKTTEQKDMDLDLGPSPSYSYPIYAG